MNTKRSYLALIILLVVLAAGIIGGTYGIQSLLKGQARQLVSHKARLQALDAEQVQLNQAKKDITKYTPLYSISKVVVPENKNQAEAVRLIVKLADDNGISLQSISFPASNLGSSGVAPKPAAGSSATTGKAPSLSQLVPVPGIVGVYDLQLSVASDPNKLATYPQLISFLKALENNRQTALVSSMSIEPDTSNHSRFSFNLTLDIYIKP